MVESATPMLRTESLCRVVGDKVIVRGVSLDLERGDILAVVGASGSGKSSLLRLLNRLDEPTSGTVYLDGVDYRELPPRTLRRRVGMVMQRPHFMPGTVGENVCFGPVHGGGDVPEERVEDLLGRVGLSGYAGRSVEKLSGGEAQRVSLARTLINSPEVLLLDEPTSALDDGSKGKVEELILALLGEFGLTCVFVTHDRGQALRVSNRAMVMEGGRVVGLGAAREVLDA